MAWNCTFYIGFSLLPQIPEIVNPIGYLAHFN